MKPLKFQKKLTFKKQIVASLGQTQLNNVRGGIYVPSFPLKCPTLWQSCVGTCLTECGDTCLAGCTQTCDTCWETNCSGNCC